MSAAPPAVCSRATRLPVPAATALLPVACARSISQPINFLLCPIQIPLRNKLEALGLLVLRRVGHSVSSSTAVAETAPFVQRNLQQVDFQGLSDW